jgi:hypothetical protein
MEKLQHPTACSPQAREPSENETQTKKSQMKLQLPIQPVSRLLCAAAVAVGIFTTGQAHAVTGFFGNIYVVAGNLTDTFYQAAGTPDGSNPQLSSGWGALDAGETFTIKGYEIKTFNDNGSSVNNMRMTWTIDAFVTSNTIDLGTPSSTEGNNKTWQLTSSTQNLLTNGGQGALANGSYTFAAYFQADTNSVDTAPIIYASNNSANYNASFSVVPEPSTYALLGLGAVALGGHLLRRRKQS